jgi:dipeptidyl aminopeptidase/acylaminoacyl peptidase
MDSFVEELRKQGKPVSYTVLKDVGHGLETPESRKLVYEGAVKFFKSSM